MNPALSIVFFSTLIGSAQGLVVALAVASLVGLPLGTSFVSTSLAVAEGLLVAGLGASFLHLGHKLRAWRAVLMWRTSWMSREVIVLPAFMAVVGGWWLAVWLDAGAGWQVALALAAIALALLLWLCTAMIYVCLRFVQEWAHPLTIANYTLIGLSSGLVLAGALGVVAGAPAFALGVAPWAFAVTIGAWICRAWSLRRNARLKPISTIQSATGLKAAHVVQKSMGMTAGSYNTREFFHRASIAMFRGIKHGFVVFGFAIPTLLLATVLTHGRLALFLVILPLQFAGLLAERWFFFAQARHPQNLYYQVVS